MEENKELQELKDEVETLNMKLAELDEEELEQIAGGFTKITNNEYINNGVNFLTVNGANLTLFENLTIKKQPIAYYINGVYQGLMNLNERTNADYIEANHDIEEDKIDLITLSDQLGIRASVGTKDAYTNLTKHINQFWKMDPTEYYEGACARMDMDEYVDHNIFQQFIVNTDWPGNNTKIWREKDGGKFRWMLFDTDFGLGLPGYEYLGSFTKNMIKWCSGDGNPQWANNRSWMTEIFDGLKRNKMFERKFTTKYLIHLSTTFTQERTRT